MTVKPLFAPLARCFALGAVCTSLLVAPALAQQGEQQRNPVQDPTDRAYQTPQEDRAESGFPAQQDAFQGRESPDVVQDSAAEDTESALQRDTLQEGDPSEGALHDGSGERAQSGAQDQQLQGYIGQPIMNPQGQELGQVDDVVRDQQGQPQLVVSTGGFLGIGARQVVVPAEQLEPVADGLRTTQPMTQEQFAQAASDYNPDQYQPTGEQAAAEEGGSAASGEG